MGTRIASVFADYYKRCTDRPDYYQAYVKLPLDTDLPALAAEFETVCEGRLDRVPQRDALVVSTDYVPAERFDAERFAAVVDRLRERCPDRYALHDSAKWRRRESGLTRRFTVVPVEPLFQKSAESVEDGDVRVAEERA